MVNPEELVERMRGKIHRTQAQVERASTVTPGLHAGKPERLSRFCLQSPACSVQRAGVVETGFSPDGRHGHSRRQTKDAQKGR